MGDKSLYQLITEARSTGSNDEQIAQALINAGWAESEIQKAMTISRAWYNRSIRVKHLSKFGRATLILLFIIFFSLVVFNTYIWRSGSLPFGDNTFDIKSLLIWR